MTLAEARSYVRARLGISSGESATLDDLIDLQLNIEYQRIVLQFGLEVTVATLVTTADDPVVDLPDDINEIQRINCGDMPLEEIGPDEFASLSAGAVSGGSSGTAYTYMRSGSRRIRIFPTPAADGADLTLWYSQEAEAWSTADQAPESLPSAFHDLPCERVVAFLALIDEATDLAVIATSRADALEEKLRRHMGRRGGMALSSITIRGTR